MGASAGINRNVDFLSHLDSLFTDEEMREAQTLFRADPSVRRSFILFVKNKALFDQPYGPGQVGTDETIANNQVSTWNKFGYRDPFRAANEMSLSRTISGNTFDGQSERSLSISWDDAIGAEVRPSPNFRAMQGPNACTLFSKKGLRAVLCAVLLPLYFGSYNHPAWRECGELSFASGSSQGSEKLNALMNPRLRELLLDAAGQFDYAELDVFLGDTERSWVEAFKKAVIKMPVVLMLSNLHRASLESRIIFVNRPPVECPPGEAQPRNSKVRTWNSAVGENLHKLCAEDCSRSKSRIIETAVFRGHLYKMSVTEGLASQLRALVPVYNSRGMHTYAVALETPFFENPAQLQELGMFEQSEKQFHQIEDLLALLPLLIKC